MGVPESRCGTSRAAGSVSSTTAPCLRTYVRTAKWVSDQESNPTDVFNLFTKSGIPFASFKSDWVGESFKVKVSPRIDEYLRRRYRANVQDALKFGLIRKDFNIDSWFDPSLLEQVLKEENLSGYWPDRPTS